MRMVCLLLLIVCACGGGTQNVAARNGDPLTAINPEELFRRGEALARAQDYVRAEQYFNAAREQGVADERVIPELMSVCVESSRISAAVGYAEPYLERHPNDFRLRQLVATLYMSLNDYVRAERHLREVLRSESEQASTHYLLALIAVHNNQTRDADLHFARYLALDPNGVHAEEAHHHLDQSARATADAPSSIPMPVQAP